MYISREKTRKRNLQYNIRHHYYGASLRMYDIDSVEVDPVTDMPVGLIETKYGIIGEVDLGTAQFKLLCNMAVPFNIPVICLVYYPLDENDKMVDADDPGLAVHMQFCVIPVNDKAKTLLPDPAGRKRMTELEWVTFLYGLRGLSVPSHLTSCDTWKPNVKIPSVIP